MINLKFSMIQLAKDFDKLPKELVNSSRYVFSDFLTQRIETILKNLNSINVNELCTNIKKLTFKARAGQLSLEAARKVPTLTKPVILRAFEKSMIDCDDSDEENNGESKDLADLKCLKKMAHEQLISIRNIDKNQDSFDLNKILLISASPVFRRSYKPKNSLIIFGKLKETPRFIKEFLETGKIQETQDSPIFPGHINELIEFAKKWIIPSLFTYAEELAFSKNLVNFLTVNELNFKKYFDHSLEIKSKELFEKCLQYKLGQDFIISIKDFDHIEIKARDSYDQKKLDELCGFLNEVQSIDFRLPSIKKFVIQGYPKELGPLDSSNSKVKHTDWVTAIDLFHSYESLYLSALKVKKEEDPFSPNNFESHSFLELLGKCPNLKFLRVPQISNFEWTDQFEREFDTMNTFIQVTQRVCPTLDSIALNFSQVDANKLESLKKFPELGKCITSLTFSESKVTDEDLEFLVKLCPNLEHFSISGKARLTDKGLKTLSQCKKLKFLNLSYCNTYTVSGLKSLASECTDLEVLVLYTIVGTGERLKDVDLDELTQKWTKLKWLEFNGSHITDKGIQALAQNCPNLELLNLHENYDITDEGLKYFEQTNHNFRGFLLKCNKKISSQSIKIFQKWTHLELLDLSTSNYLSTQSLFSLTSLPHLKELYLKDHFMSENEFNNLQARFSNIRIEAEVLKSRY